MSSTPASSAIDKALLVVDVLARARRPMGLLELVAMSQLPKPTVRRLLVGLMSHGLVMQNQERKYEVGNAIVDLAAQSLGRRALAEVSRPAIAELQRQVTGTITVYRFYERDLTPLVRLESTGSSLVVTPTASAPLYATAAGKAVLAFLGLPDLDRLVERPMKPLTPSTLSSFEDLRADLAVAAGRGFAIEDEEAEPGVRAVAAPLRTFVQQPIGAVALSAPARLMSMHELRQLARYVVTAADQVTSALGGDPVAERRRRPS